MRVCLKFVPITPGRVTVAALAAAVGKYFHFRISMRTRMLLRILRCFPTIFQSYFFFADDVYARHLY